MTVKFDVLISFHNLLSRLSLLFLWLTRGISVRIIYILIDGLHLFWFSWKITHAYISGRQYKNKLKEKHAESSEQLVSRVPTSLYTSFVSVDFEKNMADSYAAFGCTNRISLAKRYPEQRITTWVTAKNDRVKICSVHFATDKPS